MLSKCPYGGLQVQAIDKRRLIDNEKEKGVFLYFWSGVWSLSVVV